MGKIRLAVEALEVESFAVEEAAGAVPRGTIRGRWEAGGAGDVPASLASPLDCPVSAAGCSVGASCGDTCSTCGPTCSTCVATCGLHCTVALSCAGSCGTCSPCTQGADGAAGA